MAGSAWTTSDDDVIRAGFRKVPTGEIAKAMRRSWRSVYQRARTIGLAVPRRYRGPEFIEFIRRHHALGWSDTEIAKAQCADRHAVTHIRESLGLPSVLHSAHQRQRVREKTREQLAGIGLKSMADLRRKVFCDRARAAGWPEDLRPRSVQILNLLWDNGPMTRRQLSDAMGLPWLGSRGSLKSNDAEGSYLAHLMRRGLVVTLGRIVKGKGKGHSVQIYSLPLWIERKAG